ncbi:hypothetical protein HOY80DRAFT_1044948 [Tuber brumale]|nr:hypothetical protein HOY80DRAFT_1044948 [Tuber brumale]
MQKWHESEASLLLNTSNTIEVFFGINSYGKRTPPTPAMGTLQDTEALGSGFDRIHVGKNRFYVTLDSNYEKIFVIFGAGLKLVYREEIGDYVEKAIYWNIEEYASINLPEMLKYSQPKEFEEWLLSNPLHYLPSWA